jgi:hypothetical protein
VTLSMKTLSALGLVGLAVVLGRSQGSVNFSGTWILDKSQSDVSQLMATSDAPEKVRNASMTMVVEQEGSNLRVTRILKIAAEEKKEIHTYKTDGGETMNTGFQGEPVVGRAFWEGDKLVIVSTHTRRVLLKDVRIESRGMWSLSPDGKALTIAAQINSPRGEQRVRAVFDKS